jgi:hypothetical protein
VGGGTMMTMRARYSSSRISWMSRRYTCGGITTTYCYTCVRILLVDVQALHLLLLRYYCCKLTGTADSAAIEEALLAQQIALLYTTCGGTTVAN